MGWVNGLLPRTLVARVYALYAFTLLFFVSVGLGGFYAYQYLQVIEETQDSSAIMAQVVAQTVSDSAVIGDFDTIKRTLDRTVQKSSFATAAYIELNGHSLKATSIQAPQAIPPEWLRESIASRLYDINLPLVVGGRDYGVLRFTFDVEHIAGDVWWFTRFAIILALSSLVLGLLIIRYPLRRWLGTLERVQDFERNLRAGAIDPDRALAGDVPDELRATFDVLSRTARSLRDQLQSKENALKSLRSVLKDLVPAEAGNTSDDIEALSLLISRLITEREVGRRALDNQKFALDQHAIVSVADRHNRVTYVNDRFCELMGYSREQLLDGGYDLLRSDEHPPEFFRDIEQTVLAGRVWQGELCARARDGSLKWLSSTVVPLKDGEGRVEEIISIRTDITLRKQAEAALQRATAIAEAANRAKSDFLANMSHEIRTPMNAVIGMTRLAIDTEDRDEQRLYMRTVQSSADSLLSIINDILDFSKIEAGMLSMEKIPFSARSALGEALQGLVPQAHEKGLELVLDVDAHVPEMLVGDPGRLRQVIVNLVGNAIKFTEKGEVILRVRTDKSQPLQPGRTVMEFSVSDTGIGIPADKRDKVFESFMQEDTSTTRRFGGTGLGLAISNRLVGMMGGRIELDSEVGKGSTFRFRIELGVAASAAPAVAVELAGRSALVVDDNATNRAVLEGMLRRWGVSVREAKSGEEALAMLAAAPADVVLLDGRMPGMDGFETAEAIRKAGRPTRVAMLTSMGLKGDAARCRELGITGYLNKPVDRDDLLALLKHLLASAPGETGTLVTRHMLRDEKERKQGAAAAQSADGATARAPLDVLLVEDHPVNRMLAIKLLERWGHKVTVAEDGAQSLEQLRARRFDVVLMDLQMPVMGGLEATRLWRAEEKGGRVPIVAMTASAMVSDHDACIAAGMDDYIAKPFDQVVLQNLLARIGRDRAAA